MKVLLYQTEMNPGNMKGVYYFGPGAIAAYLKEKGHDVHFRTVNNTALDKEDFLSEIQRIDPGLIGFSVMTDEWFYVAKLVAWIKEKFDIPIICGGAHPTMAPEKVIANENVDMLCRGEGEYPLEELCACLDEGRDYRQIQNLWVKDGEKVFSNPLRPLIENLDDLPFPDTEMLDFQKILRENDYIARFMVRRGCPFECTYCINQGIHKLYRGKGKLVRRRSPERVIEGLKAIADKYSEIQGIGFDDDIFALDKNWLRRFCRLYSEEIGLPFSCYMRIERIDREFLEIVKNAGCTWLDIGLESGNEWLRRTILNRKMSNAEIIQKFGVIDAFEIETTSLNMVGPPYETVEMLEETIELNRRIKPTCLIAGPFQPYPGTKLGELCIERGWFSDDGMEFVDRSVSVLNLPALTRAEISYYAHRLNHAGHAIRAKKAPVGAYDFLSHLEEADIEQSSEGCVEVTVFRLMGELALKACPPSRVTYRLKIPSETILHFDIGLHEEACTKPGAGALFVIEVEYGGRFCKRDRIFSRYINPKRNKKDRGWMSFRLRLDKYYDKEVKLSFVTRPGPALVDYWSYAGWGRPYVTKITCEEEES